MTIVEDRTPTRSDNADFAVARRAMIDSQLRTVGVNAPFVLRRMGEVARERFVPAAQRALAYHDREVALGNGRAMNPPLASARLVTEADVASTDRVLRVGAATGYTAAVLAGLAGSVVALEADASLAGQAREALAGLGNVTVVEGPLPAGWAEGGPYDAIVAQAKIDGRIVTGIADRGVTRLATGRRSEGGFGLVDFADTDCVVLPGFAKPPSFQF